MKKKMKVIFSVCLVLAACMVMFTACNGENETQTSGNTAEKTKLETSILNDNITETAKPDNSATPETEIHIHVYGEWNIIKEATCTENGEQERVCTCGEKETKTVEAAHNWEKATCLVPETCSVCKLTKGNVASHTYENKVCVVCGDIQFSEGLKYELCEDSYYVVVGLGSCNDKDVFIPPIYNEKPVKGIVFSGFSTYKINSVVIPESITNIELSLYSRPNIENIIVAEGNKFYYSKDNCLIETATQTLILGQKNGIIPNGVKSIGKFAFGYCDDLTSVTIPSSVTSIGEAAFLGTDLTSINIPEGVVSIGKDAFAMCQKAETITISNTVTCIEKSAFLNCISVTSIIIPESVEHMDEAFRNCTGLKKVTISNGVKSIGARAFLGCSEMTSVTIPNSVVTIGDSAFAGCSKLTSITVPDSVTDIGSFAFSDCTDLTSITIPDSVTSIGDSAFAKCSKLTSITILNEAINIDAFAFIKCSNLAEIFYAGSKQEWNELSKGLQNDFSRVKIHYNWEYKN